MQISAPPKLRNILVFWLGVVPAFAQQPPKNVVSPEVHADRRVTFRLAAPKASEVKLWGEWITKYNTLEVMARADDGVWSATVGPVAPAVYSYLYLVDGVLVLDPRNHRVQTGRDGAEANLVEVPGDAPQPYEVRAVPHGVVHLHTYQSSTGLGARKLAVYTPPGYDTNRRTKYPVLYLMHGSGENEMTWTSVGRAHVIADNLIAGRRARPVIIVMPDGHPRPPEAAKETPAQLRQLIEQDLLKDVLPLVESSYRTLRTPSDRAIAGLSMGAFQALWHGLDHPEVFGSIGVFGGGIADKEGEEQVTQFALRSAKGKHKLDVFWIGVGDRDMNVTFARRLDALLTKHGVRHQYVEASGAGHTWPFWRQCFTEFLQLLFAQARPGVQAR